MIKKMTERLFSWTMAPKGTKSCRTEKDFCLFVHMLICSFVPPSVGLSDLKSDPSGPNSALPGLISVLSGRKSALYGLKSAVSVLESALSDLKTGFSGSRSALPDLISTLSESLV